MEGLTVGRVVHYVLSASDAQEINKLHEAANIPFDERVPGIQYHTGNRVEAGEHCAMVVVKVWNSDIGLINGKVLLDGLDVRAGHSAMKRNHQVGTGLKRRNAYIKGENNG